jgi:hypothetical protein
VFHALAKLGVRHRSSLSVVGWSPARRDRHFAAVKLSPSAAAWLADALSLLGRRAEIYLDRTDLLCLPALAIALWIGRDELRRVPLGRPAAIHRLGKPAAPALADVVWAGAQPERIATLARAIDAWDPKAIDEIL